MLRISLCERILFSVNHLVPCGDWRAIERYVGNSYVCAGGFKMRQQLLLCLSIQYTTLEESIISYIV